MGNGQECMLLFYLFLLSFLEIIPTPFRTPHNVEVVALTFSALLLIFVGVAIVIGYRRRYNIVR